MKKDTQDLNQAAFLRVEAWFAATARDLPWRRTRDPYAILVSELMLQQTQVVTVVGYFNRWMERFPTFEDLAQAPEAEVLRAWEGLGYYSRARNLHKAAMRVVAIHQGRLPADPSQIRALPGVGAYTAGAVSVFAFGLREPAVDANIARVLVRVFDCHEAVDRPSGRQWLEKTATRLVHAAPDPAAWTAAVMEIGALLCKPSSPMCMLCPVKLNCRAKAPEELPIKSPRKKTVLLDEDAVIWIQKGRLALIQSTHAKWRGLFRLPLQAAGGEASGEETVLAELDYPFTHHRIRLRARKFSQETPASLADPVEQLQWVDFRDLESVPMAAPHRRLLGLVPGIASTSDKPK